MPHPPLLIPEIGRENLADVSATIAAMEKLAIIVRDSKTDLVVMSSPHHPSARSGAVGVVSAEHLNGDFGRFGAGHVRLSFDGAPELARIILESALPIKTWEISLGELDWGFTVFLYYLQRAGAKPKILPLSMTWGSVCDYFEFGKRLSERLNALASDVRISYVASGDLSHCTRRGIGREYDPYGRIFDDLVGEAVRTRDTTALLALSEADLSRARQCGAMSFAAAMGFYSGVDCAWNHLSYQDPFGVGYLVASFEIQG